MEDNDSSSTPYQVARDSRLSWSNIKNTRQSITNISKISEKLSDSMIVKKIVYQYKVILLGDIAVGKTSIMSRFVDNKYINEYRCSLGVEFKVKSLYLDETLGADLKIWDTCGEERFRTITRQYYRESNGVILVFDLTNRNSFERLPNWIEDIKNYGPKGICIILIGNKSDLIEHRVVSLNDASIFATKYSIPYLEVSAKTGNNVVLLFENLTKMMLKQEQDGEKKKKDKQKNNKADELRQSIRLENGSMIRNSLEKEKRGCC